MSCFHSINVPSEWGPAAGGLWVSFPSRFHSINVPSEWGPLTQTSVKGILI